MPAGAIVQEYGDLDTIDIGVLNGAPVLVSTDVEVVLQADSGLNATAVGMAFSIDDMGDVLGGLVSRIELLADTPQPFEFAASFAAPTVPLANLADWIARGATAEAFAGVLQGDDTITAGPDPSIPQPLPVTTGSSYLRGEEGDDVITGGPAFDDINGNMGNDTLHGGAGDDWVVGGKDNDLQFGDDGNDIVWGNLGNDTLDGGAGNDQVRGGQGDDSISGGAGDDYISGDRGADTETGGPGADIFHSFSGAGIDRVLDFNYSEGDRVMLDPGTAYSTRQVGADTIVDMGAGDQMILVGVTLSSLPNGWIFLGP